jgi:hypothetical protein
MICYCIKNIINNKRYIGITKNIKNRMSVHLYDIKNGSNLVFHNSVRKYGFDNFEFEFINDYTGLVTYNELLDIETNMIIKYNSYFKFNKGYNMTLGGEGGPGGKKEVYQYDIKTLKLINTFESIVDASNKTNTNISGIAKNCRKEQKSAGGFIWCYKNVIPEKYKNSQIKRVCQYNIDDLKLIKIYKSIKAAENKNNLTNISTCCLGKQKSAGGFIWCFEGETPMNYMNKWEKVVYQINKKTKKIIGKFKSIQIASEETGVGYCSIQSTCKERQKSGGGFIWRFGEQT